MSDDEETLVGDLDLGVPPLAPARRAHMEYTRDLSAADLAALATTNKGTKPRSLMSIRSSHHALARCLAAGMKRNQAALVTGYTPMRITQLEADESFAALVADYRNEAKGAFADLAERMSNISLDAIELIQERLADAPGDFSVSMLLDIVKAFADRTGHGPGQELNLNMKHDFVDRPPRETFEEWKKRRDQELVLIEHDADPKKLN